MTQQSSSPPRPSRSIHGLFHFFLVAFAAPAAWPPLVIYLLAAGMAAGIAWLWVGRAGAAGNGLLTFLIMGSFFAADKDILASLPRRTVSFAPWNEQFFALALPRAAAALALGWLIPYIGWTAAFYGNIALQFLGTLALYQGAVVEPRRLEMTRLTMTSDRLAPGARPIRILHISDLHMERLGTREEQLLGLVETAAPDFILLSGDYVNLSNNKDPDTHEHVRQLLGNLSAPGGVFAVLGSPAVDLPEVVPPLFVESGVRLLRDELVVISPPGGPAMHLIGLECHHKDLTGDVNTLDRLLAGDQGNSPLVLLYHSPEIMPPAVERGIDLYLCGHTHGGQVRLPLIGPILTSSRLGRRYVMGHYREGRTHLYVSRGVGFEGLGAPRVRFRCPPEITLITLENRR
mgnify:CR=1 FL=1